MKESEAGTIHRHYCLSLSFGRKIVSVAAYIVGVKGDVTPKGDILMERGSLT